MEENFITIIFILVGLKQNIKKMRITRFRRAGKLIYILLLFLGCKIPQSQNQQEAKADVIKDAKKVQKDLPQSNYQEGLPLGKIEILDARLQDAILTDDSFLGTIFEYYSEVDAKPNPNFQEILDSPFNSFYKPKLADEKEDVDSFFLSSEEGYTFFKHVKKLPQFSDNSIMVFSGSSSNYDYDGNTIYTQRMDLVIVDDKKNIIDALNIYYDYSDGIVAKTKLFYIDESYNIFVRYVVVGEEGNHKISGLEAYKITQKGRIVKQN
ncbi:hypothetical protein ACFQ1M_18325 [Sungkyunkwania multivorans]|uniref:Lipoprotein n=1 Tax=Sungkyunkwania multivorans TaxID=1173618 RepID=A0ABW3D271_9FLAO